MGQVPLGRPLVMGIVNVTPDSFSDGGRYIDADAAAAHAGQLIAQGADILDIGAESTRPRAEPVDEAEELRRLIPVIEKIRAFGDTPISVDTMKPNVARAAMTAGASIWNDVTALRWSPQSLQVAADLGLGVVLMHMLGEPGTMQDDPRYGDVVAEVCAFLRSRAEAAMAVGIPREAIWLDPGIGFGKTTAHNLALMANLDSVVGLGFPVLVGASRKRFIATIDPLAQAADGRLGGSIALAVAAARAGASAVRVHDVRETVQALAIDAALRGAEAPP
jgi:dihydropteroate synthase